MTVYKMIEDAINYDKDDRKQKKLFIRRHEDEFYRVAFGLSVIQEYVIRVHFASNSLDIGIAGDYHVFKGLHQALRKLGYNCTNRPKQKIFSSHCCWWHHTDENQKLSLWVTFSSTKCKRVKIGTEMIEQDIFETVCD